MGPRLRHLGLPVLLLASVLSTTASEAPTHSWIGLGTNSQWTTAGNWLNGIVPPNDGTAHLEISPTAAGRVTVDVSQNIDSLLLLGTEANRTHHSFFGTDGSTLTLNSGLSFRSSGQSAAGGSFFDSSLGVVVAANQNWSVASGAHLKIAAPISGSGQITLADEGELSLLGTNSYTGGTVLQSGALGLGNDSALGTGALTISSTVEGAVRIMVLGGARTLANDVNLNSDVSFSTGPGTLTFDGETTLGANVSIVTEGKGEAIYFNGKITGAHSLSVSGGNLAVLSGANDYSGGTEARSGGIVFRTVAAVPTVGLLTAATYGYIGLATPPTNPSDLQTAFLDRFDKSATVGIIGFDTDPAVSTTANVFSGAIDLTGFSDTARIGTATKAELTGTITPVATAGYQLGGGGGELTIASQLTGTHQVFVESLETAPTTVHLTSTSNDYTGPTTSVHSAIVFGADALPSGTELRITEHAYIGTKSSALNPSSYLSQFASTTEKGIIGFDSDDANEPNLVGAGGANPISIDLSRFTGASPQIYLGTASGARLAGPIVLPENQNDYRFAGFKGGRLQVESELSGNRSVIIGDGSVATTGGQSDVDGDSVNDISAVFLLNSGNTYTGGTKLLSGRLGVGQAGALGTGDIEVLGSNRTGGQVVLESISQSPIDIANNINLFTSLLLGGVNPFTLSGTISGNSDVLMVGNASITLVGANTFTGGVKISNNSILIVGHDGAIGAGGLGFDLAGGTATFTTSAPTIGWLRSEVANAFVNLPANATLTLNQSIETNFRGVIAGDNAALVQSGSGQVYLGGTSPNTYSGGTTIGQGALVAGKAGAFGTGSITVHNGALLGVDTNVTVGNSLVLNDGARIGGYGTLSPGGTLEIKGGTTLAPGGLGPFDQIGTLTIANGTNLTFAESGRYAFEIMDASGAAGTGYDLLRISATLALTASSATPFVISVATVDPATGAAGDAARFDNSLNYFWTIAEAGSISGFSAQSFLLDTSAFTNALGGGSFRILQSENNLVLQFAPVPEPSTWALIVLGLSAVAVTTLRRRKQK